MSSPLVSVILPVFNAELFLAECIESVLGQTFEEFEFLIVDDGSTDKSNQIIRSFSDSRITVLQQDCNKGLVAALNRAIDESRGEYIARIDADDVSLSHRFNAQLDFFETYDDVGLVSGGVTIIDENSNALSESCANLTPEYLYVSVHFRNHIFHSTVMMRADIVHNCGGYKADMIHVEDFNLWQKISDTKRLCVLPELVGKWRNHNSISTRFHESQEKTARYALRQNIQRKFSYDIHEDTAALLRGDFSIINRIGAERLCAVNNDLNQLFSDIILNAPPCLDSKVVADCVMRERNSIDQRLAQGAIVGLL